MEAFRVLIEELYTTVMTSQLISRADTKHIKTKPSPQVVYSRWLPPQNYHKTVSTLSADFPIPYPFNRLLIYWFYRKISAAMHSHGIARRSHTEIEFLTKRWIDSLSDQLGGKKWLFSDEAGGWSRADLSLFGVLKVAR